MRIEDGSFSTTDLSAGLSSLGRRRFSTSRSSTSLTTTTLLFECRSIPRNFMSASIRAKDLLRLVSTPCTSRRETQAPDMIVKAGDPLPCRLTMLMVCCIHACKQQTVGYMNTVYFY